MPLRLLTAFACLVAALALTPVAQASLTMYMGAAEDEGRNADPLVAAAKLDLARDAGFEAIRITAIWTPGLSELPLDQLEALRSIAAAGDFNGIKIVVTVMPYGSSVTPLTARARRDFASFAADVVERTTIREVIVGNEPNLNRYWLPQFGPNGEDVAAPAYEALLAQAYDAIKAVDPTTFVLGGSVSPRGQDDATAIRHTHSPTTFNPDMGAAYRARRPTSCTLARPRSASAITRSSSPSSAAPSTGRRNWARSCRSSTTSTASTRSSRRGRAASITAASRRRPGQSPRACRRSATAKRSCWPLASRRCAAS